MEASDVGLLREERNGHFARCAVGNEGRYRDSEDVGGLLETGFLPSRKSYNLLSIEVFPAPNQFCCSWFSKNDGPPISRQLSEGFSVTVVRFVLTDDHEVWLG